MKSIIQQYYHDTPVDTEHMLARVHASTSTGVAPSRSGLLLLNGVAGFLLLLFFLQYSVVFSMGFFAPFMQVYSLFGSVGGFAFHMIMATVAFVLDNYRILLGISFLGFISQVGVVTVWHRGLGK